MLKSIVIKFDADADVYYTASSDIPGFALESEGLETLINRCKPAAIEMLELNGEKPSETFTLRFIIDIEL